MQPFFLVIIKTSKHLFIHPLEFHEVLLLYTPLKEKYYLGEGDKGRQIGCEVRLALALWQPKQKNMNCGSEQFHPQYVGANKFPFFLFHFAQIFIQA